MNAEPEALLAAALQLSLAERQALLVHLIESVPIDDVTLSIDDPRFVEELDRRFADDEGAVAWNDLYLES